MQLTPEQQEHGEKRVTIRFTAEQKTHWQAAVEQELAGKEENIAHFRKIKSLRSVPSSGQRYNFAMSTIYENTVLDEVLEPVARCFTPDVARQIAALRTSPALQTRLDELAHKANEGELTSEERETYEAYVEAIDLIGILQAKARKILAINAAC